MLSIPLTKSVLSFNSRNGSLNFSSTSYTKLITKSTERIKPKFILLDCKINTNQQVTIKDFCKLRSRRFSNSTKTKETTAFTTFSEQRTRYMRIFAIALLVIAGVLQAIILYLSYDIENQRFWKDLIDNFEESGTALTLGTLCASHHKAMIKYGIINKLTRIINNSNNMDIDKEFYIDCLTMINELIVLGNGDTKREVLKKLNLNAIIPRKGSFIEEQCLETFCSLSELEEGRDAISNISYLLNYIMIRVTDKSIDSHLMQRYLYLLSQLSRSAKARKIIINENGWIIRRLEEINKDNNNYLLSSSYIYKHLSNYILHNLSLSDNYRSRLSMDDINILDKYKNSDPIMNLYYKGSLYELANASIITIGWSALRHMIRFRNISEKNPTLKKSIGKAVIGSLIISGIVFTIDSEKRNMKSKDTNHTRLVTAISTWVCVLSCFFVAKQLPFSLFPYLVIHVFNILNNPIISPDTDI